MKMSKLSNQTNSQDPQAVNSRVFVGNLNTFQCSKTDVERMFQRYGRLAGISMHKGYAFVQFTNPFDARNACHGEDGRTVLSQTLDVNMVAEPKPHQTGRKRQNKSKTGNDWDYYYDSYYASTLFGPLQQQPNSQPRPLKRQRLMAPGRMGMTPKLNGAGPILGHGHPQQQQQQQQQQQKQQQQQQQQQHLQLAAHTQQQLQQHLQQAATSPVANACQQLGNFYNAANNGNTMGNQIGSSNGVQLGPMANGGGCIGSNGYINNNNCMMNGVELGGNVGPMVGGAPGGCNMSNYTNGQHVVGPFKTYSNPDTLICGNCRELFTDLTELLDHKRSYCKLRFTCKCLSTSPVQKVYPAPHAKLLCVACKDSFSNPWDLMVHAQAAHMVNIYELGSDGASGDDSKTSSSASSTSSSSSSTSSSSTSSSAASGCDRTANSTPTMPTSPSPLAPELAKVNGNGLAAGGGNATPATNGVHELDDLKHDHAEETQSQATLGSPEALQLASSSEDISSMTDSAVGCNGKVDPVALLANGFVNGATNEPPRACIMTALSIDTKSNPDASVALKMVTSSMGITLTNGAAVTAVTQ
uniref:Uncharacterized protein n=1 Tax=Anopheles atroparvus TaxID=41427 RepID=A0A182J6N2_ANOAO